MPSAREIDTLCQQAQTALRQAQYDRAIEIFRQALTYDPDRVDIHQGLGTALFHKQDYEPAIEHFTRWMQIRPHDAKPNTNLGAVYNRMGEYQKAADILHRGIQKDASSFEAYYNLGIAHRKLRQHGMAMNAYREALRINPESPEAHQNLANVYLKMGNSKKAIEHFEKALEIKPKFAQAMRGLEKAQQVAKQSTTVASPFGRLVDQATLERNVAASEFRELSVLERFEDRRALRDITQQIITTATEWLEHLHQQLAPSLIAVDREIGEEHSSTLADACETLAQALQKYESLRKQLESSVQRLREHEDGMKQPGD